MSAKRNLLIGMGVGAVLGILFAPEKGSVTRQQITDKGNDYAKDLKSKYGDIADTLKEKFQAVKKDAKNIAENGIDQFEKVQGDFDEAKY